MKYRIYRFYITHMIYIFNSKTVSILEINDFYSNSKIDFVFPAYSNFLKYNLDNIRLIKKI